MLIDAACVCLRLVSRVVSPKAFPRFPSTIRFAWEDEVGIARGWLVVPDFWFGFGNHVCPYIERSAKGPPVLHTRDRFLYGLSSVTILLPTRFLLSYPIVSRSYITTNGANTIGAHRKSTRWYPYNEESTFPEGIDCLVAGVISYTPS